MSAKKVDSKSDNDSEVHKSQDALKQAESILKAHFKDVVILVGPWVPRNSDMMVRWHGNFMACYGMGAAFLATGLERAFR